MELYYFITGAQTFALAVLLYQYRKILVTVATNQKNIQKISATYESHYGDTSRKLDSVQEALNDTNDRLNNTTVYSEISSIREENVEVIKQVNTLAKEMNNLREVVKSNASSVENTLKTILTGNAG